MVQLYHNRNVNKNSLLFKVDYTSITMRLEKCIPFLREIEHSSICKISVDFGMFFISRKETG